MVTSRATAVLPILYLASLLSYADRIIFSLALQPIKQQFGFSDSQLGLLAGLAFGVSYAAFSPIAGWFADRRSRKAVLIVAVLAWSGATFATAFATSFTTMFTARALVGMGEAAVMPLAVSMLSDTRNAAERGRAFGLFLSASALGTVMGMVFGGAVMTTITRWGGLTLPVLGPLLPWQTLFIAASCLGLVFVLVVSIVLRDPPRSVGKASARQEDDGVWRFVVANPMIIFTLYIGLSFIQMATVTNLIWIVAAFGRAHGLSAGSSALSIGSSAGIAMVLGCFAAGWMIARVRTRGESAASLTVCLASSGAFAIFTSIGLLMTDMRLALAFVTIGTFFSYAPTISALSVMGEALPAPIRARLAGFNTMSNAVICNSLGSLLVGVFGDRLFSGDTSIAHALACVIGIGTILGGGLVLLGLPTYRRHMRLLGAEGAA
jgi:MFS family permease